MSARPHPFRFSSPITGCTTRRELVDRAKALEDLGYSAVTVADHFGDQFGPIAAMMAVADATTTLRIAPTVFCNDYRHPVILAKEAATLDLLSEGRLEFGLGAGWKESDYQSSGIDFDRPGVRIDRMTEALQVIKGLWGDGPFTFHGDHYRITDLDAQPAPMQRPHPPVTIGGGSKRVLSLAAREADVVGLIPSMAAGRDATAYAASATAEATQERIDWVRAAAGDRFDHLELQVRLEVAIVVDDPDPLFESMSGAFGLTPDQARETPYALLGTIDHMAQRLVERRDRWGFSYIGVPQEAADDLAPLVQQLTGR